MNVVIHKNIIGENKHMCQSGGPDGRICWSENVPNDAWTLGFLDSNSSIEEFSFGLQKEIPSWPPERVKQQFIEILGEDFGNVRWSQAIPKNVFLNSLKALLKSIWELLESEAAVTYSPTFRKASNAFLALTPAKINAGLVAELASQCEQSQKENLNSFLTDSGVSPKIVYSRKTTTGRMTVAKGPAILHLKKQFRTIIASHYDNGRIVQLDYSALEPRVLLAVSGKVSLDDPYDDFMQHTKCEITREQAKIVVMGILYGIGLKRLRDLVGDVDIVKIVDDVRDFFQLSKIETFLEIEYKTTGKIKNFFGRVLEPGRSDRSGLLSYYNQSSAVEVALMGFEKIIEKIIKANLEIKPLFFIHDAMLLDVHSDISDLTLEEFSKEGLEVPGLPGKFPLKLKNLFK